MVDSVLSAGVRGMQAGVERAQSAASDIARAGTVAPERGDTVTDITEAAVELKVAEQQVVASASVVRTADEVLGTLVDTTA